jgi:hypothetical protein
MSDAVELAEVPQLFERWRAGGPLAGRSRSAALAAPRMHDRVASQYKPACARELA